MARLAPSNDNRRQAMVDIVVAMIAIPLLIVFGVMLQSNMEGDWIQNPGARWRILGLGLSLLFVSLMMCLYVTHRLGLCIWAAQQQEDYNRQMRRNTRNTPYPFQSTGSQLHLMVSGELPPSYDSVVRCADLPPPYCTLIIYNESDKSVGNGPPEKQINPSDVVPGQTNG